MRGATPAQSSDSESVAAAAGTGTAAIGTAATGATVAGFVRAAAAATVAAGMISATPPTRICAPTPGHTHPPSVVDRQVSHLVWAAEYVVHDL